MRDTDGWWEVNVCIILYRLVHAPDELEAEHERPFRRVRTGREHQTNRALCVPEILHAAPPVRDVVGRTIVHV